MSTIFDHFCQLMLSSARNSSSCTMNQLLPVSRLKKINGEMVKVPTINCCRFQD